ncbi:hypothetical protein X769_28570 [Mesorhizobium sp. LSJC268A00]|nr:hypothetical protein X769_28570 [Mesorhizobium sp. LSJC268A00]
MTTHTPLARYSATNGALVSGFATAELHHLMGHDPDAHQMQYEIASSWRMARSRNVRQLSQFMYEPQRLSIDQARISSDAHAAKAAESRRDQWRWARVAMGSVAQYPSIPLSRPRL